MSYKLPIPKWATHLLMGDDGIFYCGSEKENPRTERITHNPCFLNWVDFNVVPENNCCDIIIKIFIDDIHYYFEIERYRYNPKYKTDKKKDWILFCMEHHVSVYAIIEPLGNRWCLGDPE